MRTAIEIKTDMIRERLVQLLHRYCQSGLRSDEVVTFRALAELTSALHSLAVDSMESLNRARAYLLENGGSQDTIDANLFRANAAVSQFMSSMATIVQRAVDIESDEYEEDTNPNIRIVHDFPEEQ